MTNLRILGSTDSSAEWQATEGQELSRLLGGRGYSSFPTEDGFQISVFEVTEEQSASVVSAIKGLGIQIMNEEIVEDEKPMGSAFLVKKKTE